MPSVSSGSASAPIIEVDLDRHRSGSGLTPEAAPISRRSTGTLAGLVDDGLATRASVAQETRPTMHVHTPTEAGLAELDDSLRSPLERERAREPFLLRLFFAGRLPVADATIRM